MTTGSSAGAAPAALFYKRSRFTARLPADRRYTAAHMWLAPEPDGVWRIGFTKFAARMLGELVECGFEVAPDASVEVGDVVGWMEGFKASTDLYAAAEGAFAGGNPLLAEHPERLHADPHGDGWMYRIRGQPDPTAVDAAGYAALLDAAIDRIQGSAHAEQYVEPDCQEPR